MPKNRSGPKVGRQRIITSYMMRCEPGSIFPVISCGLGCIGLRATGGIRLLILFQKPAWKF